MPKERGDSGQFVETVTLEDVLEVFDDVEGPPVVTSADIAEHTGLSRDSARRKLENLRDQKRVDRRRSAGRVLYWPVEYENQREVHSTLVDQEDDTPAHETSTFGGEGKDDVEISTGVGARTRRESASSDAPDDSPSNSDTDEPAPDS